MKDLDALFGGGGEDAEFVNAQLASVVCALRSHGRSIVLVLRGQATNAFMSTQPIAHEWWRSFLLDVAARFGGVSTTIRVRALPSPGRRWVQKPASVPERELARALPLVALDYESHPTEVVRFTLLRDDQSLETVEVEHPVALLLLDAEKQPHAPSGGVSSNGNDSHPVGAELNGGDLGARQPRMEVTFCIETATQIYTVVVGPGPP